MIQNYKLPEETITSCIVKSDLSNEDKIILLVTDNYGYLHIFDLAKKQKISKTKIHDVEITQSKVSKRRNIIYTLDVEGILKMTNFSNDSLVITEKTFNLKTLKHSSELNNHSKTEKYSHNQINDKVSHFELDKKEKNLVFNKGLKIKILNLDNFKTKTVGAHSSQISHLTFSSDSKFVVSSTEKDYFVYLWEWKIGGVEAENKSESKSPVISLQVNSLISRTIIRKIPNAEGIYHAFSYNMENAYGHLINFDKSSLNSNSNQNAPIIRSFQIHSAEKNLINVEFVNSNEDLITDSNTPMNISVIYGNTFIPTNIIIKEIKYAHNFRSFVEEEINLAPVKTEIKARSESSRNLKPDQGKVILNKNFSVLNEIEMNENNNSAENVLGSNINREEVSEERNVNTFSGNSLSTLDEKISLINIIKNSIINNDISTLEWTLEQKDISIIETTVRKMNSYVIKLFISKLIDLFQSSRLTKSKSNFLIWIDLLFKYHTVEILQMPIEIINTLKKVKSIVNSRSNSLERLLEVNQKFEGILKEINFDLNGREKTVSSNEFLVYEPLLVYHESDSEDEKKTKNKISLEAEKKGLRLTKEKEFVRMKKEFNDDAGDVNMFVEDNAFEDDAMIEDLDAIDEEGTDAKDEEDIKDEDDEDFEEDD